MSFAAYWESNLCISWSQMRLILDDKITVVVTRPRSSQLVECPE